MNVTIFADASYCNELRVGGYGFWVACERGKKAGGGRLKTNDVSSSTVAEMMALANALHCAIAHGLVLDNDTVLLQTDCMAAIDAFEGRRTRLIQQELQIIAFMRKLIEKGKLKLTYRHVKGHTGNGDRRSVTNHLCDKRARKGLNAARTAKRLEGIRNKLEKPNGSH